MKKRKTGTVVFYVIYFLFFSAAAAAAVFLLAKLWDFLEEYESSQLCYVTDAVLEKLNGGDYAEIYKGADTDISPYETEDALYRQIATRIDGLGGEITCTKSAKQSRADKPVYVLSRGGEQFAYMSLKKGGKTEKYGIDLYEFDSIYGIAAQKDEYVYVTLPSSVSFTINGQLPAEELREEASAIPGTERFGEFLTSAPVMETYFIGGFLERPVIRFHLGEKELAGKYDEESRSWSCGLPVTDEEALRSAKEFALDFSHKYSSYIANDISFAELSKNIPADTKLYGDMYNYEGQYYTWHSGYEFKENEITSAVQYSDKCFSVSVRYKHIVYFGGEEYEYPADNTVFLVKNGEGWQVADLIMN